LLINHVVESMMKMNAWRFWQANDRNNDW